MKKILSMLIGFSMLLTGCVGGTSGVSGIVWPFIGDMKAEISQGAFMVQQAFSKILSQEIVLIIRDKNSKQVLIRFVYDKYSESGLFDEKIKVLFDKKAIYEACLKIGEYQTEWIEFIK